MVFHMLRAELGDDAFTALLRDFYKQHDGKTATIDEFREAGGARRFRRRKTDEPPVNLLSFFSQWLNSTGVPEFTLDYIVYRTPKGFQVVGKMHQDLDTFRMPVEMRVDTEGNPGIRRRFWSPARPSEFEIDTFGRPKPNGITIDPNNNLLKSSPRLRVRAIDRPRRSAGAASANITKPSRNTSARSTSSRPIRWRISAWARPCSTRRIIRPRPMRSAPRWAATSTPSGPKSGATFTSARFTTCSGQRERAVNEYSLAQHTNDDTAGAQQEAALLSARRPTTGDNTPLPRRQPRQRQSREGSPGARAERETFERTSRFSSAATDVTSAGLANWYPHDRSEWTSVRLRSLWSVIRSKTSSKTPSAS